MAEGITYPSLFPEDDERVRREAQEDREGNRGLVSRPYRSRDTKEPEPALSLSADAR